MNAEKWHHSEIRIAINDESQGSIAKNLRCNELLYYTFAAVVYSGLWNFLYGRCKQLFVSELNNAYFSRHLF